jgi:hypothetical protein
MVSEATSVTAYLETVPGKRKAALKTIRRLCKEILIGMKKPWPVNCLLIKKLMI